MLDPGVGRHDLVEEVLWEGQEHGPGSTAEGLADRLGHGCRDISRAMRFGRPLREAAERGDLVDLLEGFAPEQRTLDLAAHRKHGGGVLAGRVDPDGHVGSAHGSRPETHGRPACQLAVGFGHERGGAFVTGRDHPDARTFEGIEQPQERLARDGERIADTGAAERFGDEPAHRSRADVRGGLDDRFT